MLSFKALSEKKTKVKINPKMADVMEGGAPITMHPYSKGGKVKKKGYAMGGKVSLDGKYVSEGDDELEPYFLINTDDGVGYIYPYAFLALPKKAGGHHIVRMD